MNGKTKGVVNGRSEPLAYPIPKPRKHDNKETFLKYANTWKYDE